MEYFLLCPTPTLRQLVFKQKKMSLREEISAYWKMALMHRFFVKVELILAGTLTGVEGDTSKCRQPFPQQNNFELEFP